MLTVSALDQICRFEKRFYTYPFQVSGEWIKYPFVCVPFHDYKLLFKFRWKFAILDCGVEIFAKGAKEYPKGFFLRYEWKAQQLTQIFGDRLWITIPDYPDDYRNNPIENNVERTLANIKRFHNIKGVNWLYPIQSSYLDIDSFHFACHEVQKFNPKRVAIGTVCKTNNLAFIVECCKMARKHFPNAWIHAFGPTLRALPKILPYIDSWDSTAFFCSREKGKGKCWTKKERLEYFIAYLERVFEILTDYHSQTRLPQILSQKTLLEVEC